jgi:hypothetical protein
VGSAGTVTTTAGAIIVTVTFASAYSVIPSVIIQSTNAGAGGFTRDPYVVATTGGFTLRVGGTGGTLTAATTYTWSYIVVQ